MRAAAARMGGTRRAVSAIPHRGGISSVREWHIGQHEAAPRADIGGRCGLAAGDSADVSGDRGTGIERAAVADKGRCAAS